MGCNPNLPITITAYDPNAPERTAIIQEFTMGNPPQKKFRNSMNPGKTWDYFFVDTFYVSITPSVPAGQAQWRLCGACMGLFFDGHGSKGVCPKGGPHRFVLSSNYWLTGSGQGQSNWRWCRTCEGLFFAGNKTLGVCPVNANGHDGSQSGDYVLTHNSGPGQQANWRWCRACQGLFFAGAGGSGTCPANPNGHDGTQSGNYILSLTTG